MEMSMRKGLVAAFVAAVLLAGCASPNPETLKARSTVEELRAQLGQERATYPLPDGGKRLEFRGRGPNTFMVDVDASGRMVEWEQVLTEANFRNIRAGMTAEQVLMTLGQPDEKSRFGRQAQEFWSYHFQNTQCLWFQVPFGPDGRTSGSGSTALTPPCLAGGGGGGGP
jgi:outer membrane protein assembly factor BamE (lipoprotein component of BamABCDE complex)